ncbi:MAG: LysR family transcriptional regulator [Caldilineaceae bacterium]|nr:LysR family transcriptional regulator [Caldilineaceae bacterium]
MLNLYKLDIFTQVVEAGSFSAAAERLLMSQSGVSQHIQDLERSLGVKLLTRSARGVQLTEPGKTLYEYAQRIAILATEAEAAVTDVAQLAAGEILLGATPGVGVYVLAVWVESFGLRYPRLSVNVQTDITPRIVEMLLAQRLDIGIVEGELNLPPDTSLISHELETVEHFAVVGRKHHFWALDAITLDDLAGHTLITRQRESQTRIWLDEILAQNGIRVRIGAEFDNVESIKRAVMAGTALTILPRYAVADEVEMGLLHALPIAGSPLQRVIKLLWDKRRPFGPVTRSFLRHLAARFPALGEVVSR